MAHSTSVSLAAIAALALLSSCAMTSRGPTVQQRIAEFDDVQPDRDALARGDLGSTTRVLDQMSQFADRIDVDERMERADKDTLIARIHAAERRFRLAAAPFATPDLGYWLARTALVAGDDQALALVRRMADARAADRQHQFATAHTYRHEQNDPVARASKGLVVAAGNCVFATEAFGPEGTENPTLAFRFAGVHPRVHVRCYLARRPEDLPAKGARLAVTIAHEGGTYEKVLPIPHGWPAARRDLDFVLDEHGAGWLTDPAAPFENLQVKVVYVYPRDNVVVWDHGAQRMRIEYATVLLASSPLFWDRDSEAPAVARH